MVEDSFENSGPRFAPPTEPLLDRPVPTGTNWPTVLGVISICLGALGVLGGVWGAVSQQFMSAMGGMAGQEQEAMFEVLEEWQPWILAQSAIGSVLAIALLIVGIGLVKRRPFGVSLGRTWAVLKLLFAVFVGGIQFRMQPEVLEAMMEQGGAGMPALSGPLVEAMAIIIFVVTVGWYGILPVFMLIWFSRGIIKQEVADW
jgi:hypothetical protein